MATMISNQLNPIYNAGVLYKNGMMISRVNGSQLAVSAGACRDQNNIMDIEVGSPNIQGSVTPEPLIIDFKKTGINGLIGGDFVQNTLYQIYMLADSRGYQPTGAAAIPMFTNNAAIPFGYDSYRLIGYWMTDVTDIKLEQGFYSGANANIRFNFIEEGNATTFTPIDLSAVVPSDGNINIITQQFLIGNGAGSYLSTTGVNMGEVRPIGYVICQFNGQAIYDEVSLVAQQDFNNDDKASIKYLVSNSSDLAFIGINSFDLSL
jgi:hypothetical protein